MLEPAATKIGMPMEEFIRLYDTEGPFELIDGERIPIMPDYIRHLGYPLAVNEFKRPLRVVEPDKLFHRHPDFRCGWL